MNAQILFSQSIDTALSKLGLDELDAASAVIEHPANPDHGDFASNVAMVLFGQLKKQGTSDYSSPRALAEAIAELVKKTINPNDSSSTFSEVSVAGPGFINVALSDGYLVEELQDLVQTAPKIDQQGVGKKLISEYSSPNIAKPFTIGHLRSTIIGDAVANIYEAMGYSVYRDNHLGDWGTQFGKQIYAIKTWGDEQEIENSPRPVKKLVELYVKFHEEAEKDEAITEQGRAWFKKLEDGDQEARRLWKKCVDWSMKEFSAIYDRLNVHFTENNGLGYGESFFEDKMGAVLDELKEKNLITESEGAQLVFFLNDEFPPMMVLKRDGATLYATRDLATDKFRLAHYGSDIIVTNETGLEQSLYWQQLFRAEEMLGWYKPGQRIHIGHGLISFKDKKMSTRKGNVIWLEDVLQEAFDRVKQRSKSSIDDESIWKIAVAALKVSDLKRDPKKNMIFDWDEVLSIQGNSGPYLLYAVVRTKSLLSKVTDAAFDEHDTQLTVSNLHQTERLVMRKLLLFNQAVVKAAQDHSPHYVTHYLFDLAQAFSAFYTEVSILNEPNQNLRTFRLQLTKAVQLTLTKGLELLGIETVEKM